jgi:biotin carboxyl carrier protein
MELLGKIRNQYYAVEIEAVDADHFRVSIIESNDPADPDSPGNAAGEPAAPRVFEVDCREPTAKTYSLLIGHQSNDCRVHREPKTDRFDVHFFRETLEVEMADPMKRLLDLAGGGGRKGEAALETSMPGQILRLLVNEGDAVEEGDGLLVLVAMKMETELGSPIGGVVKEIHVAEGDKVESGQVLVTIGPPEE